MLRTDVLVIGGGVSGAAAALAAAEQGANILLVSKSEFVDTNTNWAQGGIAGVLGANDSVELHLEDTCGVGQGLTDRAIAKTIVEQSREAIEWIRNLGAHLDTGDDGKLLLSREGGHTVGRVAHAGDATGAEIQRVLTAAVLEHPSVECRADAFVRDLLTNEGRCVGAVLEHGGISVAVEAAATIVCAGGAGQVYRETTNPVGACGDGIALAFRAGAEITDMEFIQFHPTTLYIAGASRFLVSEVVRGAGAVLCDRNGDRFMPAIHELAELAPRDVVSRAILERMVQTKDTHVYLDLSTVEGDPHKLFPSISRICRSFDMDVAKDPIPVRPGAHYVIGGVRSNTHGATSLPGLFAAGEAAASGFHGANRLASNSLLEGAVMGQVAGNHAAAERQQAASLPRLVEAQATTSNPPRILHEDMLYSLKSLMWRDVGLVRNATGLEEAHGRIGFWNHYLLRSQPHDQRAYELANMLAVSSLIADGAARRAESRGTHFRSDFPERDDARWCRRILLQRDEAGLVEATEGSLQTPSDRRQ